MLHNLSTREILAKQEKELLPLVLKRNKLIKQLARLDKQIEDKAEQIEYTLPFIKKEEKKNKQF